MIDLDSAPRPERAPTLTRRRALGATLGLAGLASLVALDRARGADTTWVSASAPTTGGWGSFADQVPGDELYLLVAIDVSGAVIAHACDGARVAVWFTGQARDGALAARARADRVAAEIAPDRIEGNLTVRGERRRFRLPRLASGGGLLAARTVADGVVNRAGWILLGDGRQRGVLTVGGVPGPAPFLDSPGSAVITAAGVRLHPVRMDRLSRKWGRLPAIPVV